MQLTEGSMYSGYGGLGMALRLASALPVRTLWHCDPDPDCDATLAKYHPGVPNLGSDIAPDWSVVEPPDILTLSCPCQPASAAGKRGGADDPRWRWPYALVAVRALRAPVVFFENVAGLAQRAMRPLWGGILADLRDAGYQVAWTVLGACYVGAPHCRRRVFAIGRPRDDPGPAVKVGEKAFCDHGHGRLFPTVKAGDARRGHNSLDSHGGVDLAGISQALPADGWGGYAQAVAHWEALTRPAPDPVDSTNRLAPALPEWMMGLPDGYLTGHLPRPAAIRLAGNGVVPLQAATAFRILWPHA